MPLNDAGIPFDFDVPAFLAGENGLVAVLVQKQARFIAGCAVGGAGPQDGKLHHPAGLILKPFHSQYVVAL